MIHWKKGEKKQLSKHFSSTEFENKGDKEFFLEEELIEKLEKVREEFGKAITITSGYRSPEYNKKIGGAPASSHISGMAADVTCSNIKELDKLYEICENHFEAVGDGRKKGFVHVDIRKGKKRRWLY